MVDMFLKDDGLMVTEHGDKMAFMGTVPGDMLHSQPPTYNICGPPPPAYLTMERVRDIEHGQTPPNYSRSTTAGPTSTTESEYGRRQPGNFLCEIMALAVIMLIVAIATIGGALGSRKKRN